MEVGSQRSLSMMMNSTIYRKRTERERGGEKILFVKKKKKRIHERE